MSGFSVEDIEMVTYGIDSFETESITKPFTVQLMFGAIWERSGDVNKQKKNANNKAFLLIGFGILGHSMYGYWIRTIILLSLSKRLLTCKCIELTLQKGVINLIIVFISFYFK